MKRENPQLINEYDLKKLSLKGTAIIGLLNLITDVLIKKFYFTREDVQVLFHLCLEENNKALIKLLKDLEVLNKGGEK